MPTFSLEMRATMFGCYYFVRDTIVAVAAFAGGLLWEKSPELNLAAACAAGLLGTIWFALAGRDVFVAQDENPPD